MLSDGLHSKSWSNYEDEGVGLSICKDLKLTIYSRINPTSYLKTEDAYSALLEPNNFDEKLQVWRFKNLQIWRGNGVHNITNNYFLNILGIYT